MMYCLRYLQHDVTADEYEPFDPTAVAAIDAAIEAAVEAVVDSGATLVAFVPMPDDNTAASAV